MSERVTQILQEALQLPPFERATVVEKLLASLDRPDASVDALWAREAEDRIAAFEAGHIRAYEAEEVFAELDLP
jgi:putative addiction module component (TIGR02574 family)